MFTERVLKEKKKNVRYFEESATLNSWLACRKKEVIEMTPYTGQKEIGANLKEVPIAKVETIWAPK